MRNGGEGTSGMYLVRYGKMYRCNIQVLYLQAGRAVRVSSTEYLGRYTRSTESGETRMYGVGDHRPV